MSEDRSFFSRLTVLEWLAVVLFLSTIVATLVGSTCAIIMRNAAEVESRKSVAASAGPCRVVAVHYYHHGHFALVNGKCGRVKVDNFASGYVPVVGDEVVLSVGPNGHYSINLSQ